VLASRDSLPITTNSLVNGQRPDLAGAFDNHLSVWASKVSSAVVGTLLTCACTAQAKRPATANKTDKQFMHDDFSRGMGCCI